MRTIKLKRFCCALLRGSGPAGLAGMRLADTPGWPDRAAAIAKRATTDAAASFMAVRGQIWREEASNQSPKYQSTRVRQ